VVQEYTRQTMSGSTALGEKLKQQLLEKNKE